jgi:hypothetical protein
VSPHLGISEIVIISLISLVCLILLAAAIVLPIWIYTRRKKEEPPAPGEPEI